MKKQTYKFQAALKNVVNVSEFMRREARDMWTRYNLESDPTKRAALAMCFVAIATETNVLLEKLS